jgi:hypothetical protein
VFVRAAAWFLCESGAGLWFLFLCDVAGITGVENKSAEVENKCLEVENKIVKVENKRSKVENKTSTLA